MADPKPELIRGLNLRDTTALVVGTIIGTGVFLKTAKMSQAVGSPELVLLAWVAAGVLSLAGALPTYAELGSMMPEAGGEYVFLRTAYGDLTAFLFGWMRIVVGSAGSIASFGVVFATFSSVFVPLDAVWAQKTFTFFEHTKYAQTIDWQLGSKQVVAVVVIMLFSVVNCLRVVLGGRIQTVLTLGKVLGIIAIVIGVFFFAPTATWDHLKSPEGAKAWCGFSAFGVAMMGALWAYDGWNSMPMVAGEVQNPARNVPLALMIGMGIVLAVYGLANLAYCYGLPFAEIITSNSTKYPDALPVASKAAKIFLGENGLKLVSIAVLLSVIGVLNGSILTGSRVPYAMARDGLFFESFAKLNHHAVPVTAILMQGVWSSVLALSATFDQLTDGVVFASMIFYASCCVAVIRLRKTMPNAPRPYRTLGYPVVPALFVIVAAWLLVDSVVHNTVFSVAALLLILLGLPIYFFLKQKRTAR